MTSKTRVERSFSTSGRFKLVLIVMCCLLATAIASPVLLSHSVAAPSAEFGPRLLHFNGNAPEDSGCTGVGAVDATGPSAGNCATLTETASLSSGPAAKWVAVSAVNDSVDRNEVDPNWIWNLSAPTTLSGAMTINWWQSCNAECFALGGTWRVRLWADGVLVFTKENVDGTPALPHAPSLLTTTVNLPTITANSKFVLHLDTQYSDTGAGATIFYDSSLACPGGTAGPCDSTVIMPVVDPNASPTPTPESSPSPSPMPPGPGTPRFQNYVPSSSSFSGGEPSIGTNWKTGNAMYLASYNPIRITFDDCSSPATDTWTATTIPTAVSLDPILFTDHMLPAGTPNRTFVSQLTGQDSITFFTDDDGETYSPSQGGGIPSGVDHQTLGAGPYKPNTTPSAGPRGSYPHAVYYCSQDVATAFCARSDDGGQTFGAGIPIYQALQCTGIHGHVKVAPDGTVYVPNRDCGGKASVIVSTDNGVSWAVRPAPSSSRSGFLVDPSVGIGLNNVGKPNGQASNTIYLGYQDQNSRPRIAVSHDQGATWVNDQDVGAIFGIQNSTFPEVVAGDDNRAAYAFLGTTVAGDYTNQATYNQSAPWHLYIATTFDGGQTWTTVDATPNDPVQRGSICNLGTTSCNGHTPNDRNLLDFNDATVDGQGRTLVAYADGCVGRCRTHPTGAFPNSYTARASVARQSGGRRLFAAFDPAEPNLPGAPKPKAEISSAGGPTVVSWPAADDAGAAITSYRVYRRDGANGSFNLVGTVTDTSFSDNGFTAPATSNAYRVTAVNDYGESPYCGEAVPVVVTYESSCVYPYITVGGEGIAATVPADPTGGSLTIERLNVGEPFASCGDNSLTFIMKVKSLDPQNTGRAVLPPNSEWHILFGVTDTAGNAERVFVAVDTFSPNSPVNPRVVIGRRDPTATGTIDARVCTNDLTNTCPKISANFNKDGTIIFKLDLSTPISFGPPGTGGTGAPFTWDGSAPGTDIGTAQVITGTTYILAGVGAGFLESVQTTSGEEYTRVGNTTCGNGVPTASFTANPTSGAAPLSVNFDASASSNTQSCNTIATYTLDFGDATTIAAQPTPTFSHTYNSPGDYVARLTVTDSAGHVSNPAEVVVHVTSGNTPPPPPSGDGTTVIQGSYDPRQYPCSSEKHRFTVGPGKSSIVVQVNATVPANDISVNLLFGSDPNAVLIKSEDTGTCCEALRYAPAGQVPPGEYQVQICQTPNTSGVPQNAPFTYTGTFSTTDGGSASPTPTPNSSPTPTPTPRVIPPASQDTGPKVGFENFTAPGVLSQTLMTSGGQQPNSVEYLGRNAGEPSIGNNWKTGVTAFQSDLQTLFVTFNDSCPSNGQSSTWVNRQATTSQAVNSDPIGFTDPQTGRTFAGQLTLLSPSCKTSYTDDDGLTWTPTQGSGIASGVDHQTIGGGPFAPPLTRPTNVPGVYPNAVYYCSQEGEEDTGFCSRSDDGGLTFGPSVPVSVPLATQCSGLHGHVKVSPKDGAVYLPVNYCDGVGSVLVSRDNGITWTVRQVQSGDVKTKPSVSFQDPAVAIDASGRVYYVIADDDSAAAVLTSTDYGATWQNLGDVGAAYGLRNIRYPAAIAGDDGRASVAFYGTTTPGDALQPTFDGVWHLYIANTFDGGATWTTTDATPNAPLQRGCIWAKGGANICRNLLDFFDMTVDREGRVLVGYVNGCEGGNCAQAAATAKGNAYTAAATIARQSSGRRLRASFDPINPLAAVSRPGVPSLTARRVGNVVNLGWSEADTGNSPITSYKILRGTTSGGETLLTTVPGSQSSYADTTATDTSKTYYYKVQAVNSVGTSCGANEVAAPYMGDTCSGLILHRNEPTHPEANAGMNTPASLLIDYIAVGEPPGTDTFMFKMKVNSLASIPANSRWRIAWNSFAAEAIDPKAQQFYVGMTTGPTGGPTFEWGTLADAGLPAVYAISETKRGGALAGSNFNTDGTITIYVSKSSVGNPQPGDLLGAVNGRTFTADVPGTPESKLERSNLFIDHTFVKAQTDNGAPAATYTVAGNTNCSQFIEQNVNSLVNLQVSSPSTSLGVSQFNLVIKNASTQTIFVPLRAEVAQLSSASGRVSVKNADNNQGGVNALWDYSTLVGADNILSASELSELRTLKFNNPGNEAFTVTFNVIGNLTNPYAAGGSSGGGASGGSGGGGAGASVTTSTATTLTSKVFQVTYSPLLNKLTVTLK
ncbi:MAG TPA: PKD domain-containing protein [Pyrinomonadaceae bacterium]|nr:PKD domain-containing protein [Pyrinomonadaceae bacterium]